jgi:hypothetical protein
MASMLKRSLIATASLTTLLTLSAWATLVKQAGPNWENLRLSLIGLGPVKIGMTPAQASQALGEPLKGLKGSEANAECRYVWPQGNAEKPVAFMVTHQRIARIEVHKTPTMSVSGAYIGMSEQRLKSLYSPLEMQAHKYNPKGHVFIYRSKLPVYKPYTMLFETDGQQVTTFRSGLNEEVNWVEGCS